MPRNELDLLVDLESPWQRRGPIPFQAPSPLGVRGRRAGEAGKLLCRFTKLVLGDYISFVELKKKSSFLPVKESIIFLLSNLEPTTDSEPPGEYPSPETQNELTGGPLEGKV